MSALMLLAACGSADRRGDDSQPSSAPTTRTPAVCAEAKQGTTTRTLVVDGTKRTYLVTYPHGADGSQRLPVVYLIHGLGGQAGTFLAYTGFPAASDAHRFITVAPQALGSPTRWDFESGPEVDGSDAAYLLALKQHFVDNGCADPDRQFLAGMSNGSAVTFAAACSTAFGFAGYAGVAATGFQDRCAAAPAASIIYFHGTADQVVPFEGGRTPLNPVGRADTAIEEWAAHDGCSPDPEVSTVSSDVELRRWTGCDSARIDFYVIDGGGHTWPGATPVPVLGPTTESISATDLVVGFFGLDQDT